jgi:hypothetical protein
MRVQLLPSFQLVLSTGMRCSLGLGGATNVVEVSAPWEQFIDKRMVGSISIHHKSLPPQVVSAPLLMPTFVSCEK